MANLMDLLQGQLTDSLLDQIGGQVGASKQQTATAASGIFSTLMGALSNNAKSKDGASSLASALDRDHDGSILDDIGGLLGGGSQPNNSKALNGAGILKHVLGGKQDGVAEMIGKMAGLDKSTAGNLLIKFAPMIMGALGKAKKEQSLDANGLSKFLNASKQNHRQPANPQMDMITKLLDRDGDGSITNEVTSFGFKALMGFFKRKR
jgi:hypothetical protein